MAVIIDSINSVYKRFIHGLTAAVTQEPFANVSDAKDAEVIVPSLVTKIMTALYVLGIIGAIIIIIVATGSARLSLCYNSYLGTTGRRTTLLYAAMAFVFFPLYYPYYAFFLNPICLRRIGRKI